MTSLKGDDGGANRRLRLLGLRTHYAEDVDRDAFRN